MAPMINDPLGKAAIVAPLTLARTGNSQGPYVPKLRAEWLCRQARVLSVPSKDKSKAPTHDEGRVLPRSAARAQCASLPSCEGVKGCDGGAIGEVVDCDEWPTVTASAQKSAALKEVPARRASTVMSMGDRSDLNNPCSSDKHRPGSKAWHCLAHGILPRGPVTKTP